MKKIFTPQYPFTVVDPLFIKAKKKQFSIYLKKTLFIFFIITWIIVISFPLLIISVIIALIIINKTAFLWNLTLWIKNLYVIILRYFIEQLYSSTLLHSKEKELLYSLYNNLDIFHIENAESALKKFETQLKNLPKIQKESTNLKNEKKQDKTPITSKNNSSKTSSKSFEEEFQKEFVKDQYKKSSMWDSYTSVREDFKKIKER